MTIRIKTPELKALIADHLKVARFRDVNEFLTVALKALPEQPARSPQKSKKPFGQFLLYSPLAGSGLEIERRDDHPRPVGL